MKSIHNIGLEDNVQKEFDKRKGIFNFGDNNDYPEVIKKVIDNSVTSKACVNLLTSFLYGNGFDVDNYVLNSKNETPNDILRQSVKSYSYNSSFAIHVGYNALGEKTSFKVIPFDWVRWGNEDVNGYKSKLKVCKDWSDKKQIVTTYDVYNPDHVISQIEKVGGINNYKGQIFYADLSKENIYPKSLIDSVINDAYAEYNSGLLKRNLITKGFLANTIVVTKPFESKTERDSFRRSIKGQTGASGAGQVSHIESTHESDKLSEEIHFQNIDSNINDKLFEYSDRNIADKIRKAFYNIPPSLIDANDSSLFGQSGETLKQMKLFYQDQTSFVRNYIESIFKDLFTNTVSSSLNKSEFVIKKLVEDVN